MLTAVSFHTLLLLAAQLLQEPPRQLDTTAQHSSADSSDPPSHPTVHQRADPQSPGARQLPMAQARETQQVLSQCLSSQAHLCGCDGHGQISEQGLNAHL